MSKSEQKAHNEDTTVENKGVLGKLETIEKKDQSTEHEDIKAQEKKSDTQEKTLVEATRIFLREHGIRKSGAAVRDAVEMPHEKFMPQD